MMIRNDRWLAAGILRAAKDRWTRTAVALVLAARVLLDGADDRSPAPTFS